MGERDARDIVERLERIAGSNMRVRSAEDRATIKDAVGEIAALRKALEPFARWNGKVSPLDIWLTVAVDGEYGRLDDVTEAIGVAAALLKGENR